MVDWSDVLISDLARRRTVLVLGSGVSRHASSDSGQKPPDWKTFLEAALEDCPDRASAGHISAAIESRDFLHACEWLKKRYDEEWNAYLRGVFQQPQYQGGELHQLIQKLDARIVFSLNFDDIYERVANEAYNGSLIIKQYYDDDVVEFLRGDGRYVVKVHGGLNSPDKLIFTQRDYAKARIANSSFYQSFDACLLTHSFLFIGAGYSDPDVNLVLENQNFSFPSNAPHYFLTSDNANDDLRDSLRQNRNLKTLAYDALDQDHTGLVQAIEALVVKVEEKREELKEKSMNW